MDFRDLAEKRLPAPMFHYIDGAAEDEWTYRQNIVPVLAAALAAPPSPSG